MAKQTIGGIRDTLEVAHNLLEVLERSVMYKEEKYFHSDATLIDLIQDKIKTVDADLSNLQKGESQ